MYSFDLINLNSPNCLLSDICSRMFYIMYCKLICTDIQVVVAQVIYYVLLISVTAILSFFSAVNKKTVLLVQVSLTLLLPIMLWNKNIWNCCLWTLISFFFILVSGSTLCGGEGTGNMWAGIVSTSNCWHMVLIMPTHGAMTRLSWPVSRHCEHLVEKKHASAMHTVLLCGTKLKQV